MFAVSKSTAKIQRHSVCKADGEVKWPSNISNAVHFDASLYLEIYWLIRNQTKRLRNDTSRFDSGLEMTKEKVLNTCLSFVKDSFFQLSQCTENPSVLPLVRELSLYHCRLRKPGGKLVRSYCPGSAPWHFHTVYHGFVSLKHTWYCRRILAFFFLLQV